MSLNNGEIELILRELDLRDHSIQKVVQPDFRNLYLELYRPPRAWWLRISLEHPRVRLHRSSRGPGKKRSHQRFEEFLHSRTRGGRIVAADHLHQDRIVRLEILRNGMVSTMFIRLWGTRANIIVTDAEGIIMDAFFRKPREQIMTGIPYAPIPPENNTLRECRPWPGGESFSDFVEHTYREQERAAERDRLASSCARALERRRNRLSARLQEIDQGRQQSSHADRLQHQGELILGCIHRIRPGDSTVDVEDYRDEYRVTRLVLDPALTAAENARVFFDKASRARESEEFLERTAENLNAGIATTEARLKSLERLSLEELRELAAELRSQSRSGEGGVGRGGGGGKGGSKGGGKGSGKGGGAPGLEFESRGFTILVGRNARENDHLLRRSVRGNDWWLHTRDYAGGYVFIRSRKDRTVPLDVLLDAGNLAVFFSKARSNGSADLYYTRVKHLRRPRNGPVGLVLPTQEKNLAIELDQERLRNLGIGSDLNLSAP